MFISVFPPAARDNKVMFDCSRVFISLPVGHFSFTFLNVHLAYLVIIEWDYLCVKLMLCVSV